MSKTYRITYNRLCKAVDEWNKGHCLEPGKRGYMRVLNDGNVYWLSGVLRDGSTAMQDYPLADGTLRGCFNLLKFLTPFTE